MLGGTMRNAAAAVAVLALLAVGCGAQKSGGDADDGAGEPRADGLSWAYERIDDRDGELIDGAARAADDIWALGSDDVGDGRLARGHLLHFDGKKWAREPMPVDGDPHRSRLDSLGSAGIRLSTVVKGAASETRRYALWDGARWAPVDGGTEGSAGDAPRGQITDVEVITPDDVWVLQGGGEVTHWDGERWTVTPMPADVVALAGSASDDVWAVGSRATGPGIGGRGREVRQLAAMHYDGSKWSLTRTPALRFPDPVPPEPYAELTGIDVASKTYVRARGGHSYKGYDGEEARRPEAEAVELSWDGSRWKESEPFPGACAYRHPVARDGDRGFFMNGNRHLTTDGACTRITKRRLPEGQGASPESRQQLWVKKIVTVPGTGRVLGFGAVEVLQSGAAPHKAVVVSLKR
ncbi:MULTISPECIES: hypothetical protein [unclassified Streptomyces]|uniref:hypothetical protein n=1 Tax=unclassified Streptomyces TaxID=2593676 RepID=UPI00136CADFE|nr:MULTISPECIES: hypothetical protein [unclassified Streptomyces]NDZ98039.1 hypothetical protein [Streptomyces sp. SID10116]MYY85506.1 hypothetical protein [Streptomyces sp. SID335]MYZ15431.1 hypothetical protein [Streptomyces sp. SID337]NDZ86293.1 hypothetical protein [Streptomyces sp. SID10115]NEB43722.1 hypothetical protein [Streptomyces sp. SID339]